MKKYFILICILISAIVNAQNNFKIKGKIKGATNTSYIYVKNAEKVIDSCKIENGTFKLNGSINFEPTELTLEIEDRGKKHTGSIFIGNEEATLNATIQDFPYDLKLEGSKYDEDRYTYMQRIKNSDAEKEMTQFILDNTNSPYAVRLLNANKEKFSKSEIIEYFKRIESKNFNSNYDYLMLRRHINNFDIEEGAPFFNFQAYDINNQIVAFSESFAGKNVLLNISSLHCKWCSNALPKLEQIAEKNRDKLDVLILYLDKDISDYDTLLKKQSNNWKTVWDPKNEFKEYRKYKINITPTFYLFDSNGKLIKKFDGYSPEIDKIIDGLK